MFGGRIAHGILTAGLLSAAIGTKLPGSGTIYLEQKLRYLKPVRPQDTVRAAVEIVEIIEERNRVHLKTTCTNQKGEVVLNGEALVMPPRA
ncbi:MAG: putative acyl dehydratase [Desulfotomaculum sp. 46_296]|nr:MAG: putative acyl dehydratase [Desulfotomaculum sp. 46_296]